MAEMLGTALSYLIRCQEAREVSAGTQLAFSFPFLSVLF